MLAAAGKERAARDCRLGARGSLTRANIPSDGQHRPPLAGGPSLMSARKSPTLRIDLSGPAAGTYTVAR